MGRNTGFVFLGRDDTTGLAPLTIIDSAKITGSDFQFKGVLARPFLGRIMIKTKLGNPSYTPFFALDTGVTEVHLYTDSIANSVIKGTPLQDHYNAFNQKLYNLEISFDNNFDLNRAGRISNDSLNQLQESFFQDKHNLILQQIKSNPSAITSGFIARLILPDQPDLPILEAFGHLLANANNFYARSVIKVLTAKRQSQTGMLLPSFIIKDIDNHTFSNQSFKGKYVFIDFWASWCEPCREENPELVKIYEKYAKKGIEFVGISIDMDKINWEKAIKNDGLPWIQACDLRGSQSQIFNDFGLYDIPANFLIDQKGKIVARDLKAAELRKILSEKLGS